MTKEEIIIAKQQKKIQKYEKALTVIKSQLFDVNNCDTILTKSIEQTLKS